MKLRYIQLDGRCLEFERALGLQQTAPPRLVSLCSIEDTLRSDRPSRAVEDYHDQVRWVLDAVCTMSTLRTVALVSGSWLSTISQQREALTQLGGTFEEAGAHLRVLETITHNTIPPFLYGELGDEEELLYASETKTFSGILAV